MKKTTVHNRAIILVLLSMVFIVTVLFLFISRQKQYTAYVLDVGLDGENDISIEKNAGDYWGNVTKKDNTVSQTRSATFLGVEYSGTYQHSDNPLYYPHIEDSYHNKESGVGLIFQRDSGALVQFYIHPENLHKMQVSMEDVENPEQYAKNKAIEVAGNYIDITEYELTADAPITRTGNDRGYDYTYIKYVFRFSRKINGIYSSDYLNIAVTSKGVVTGFTHRSIQNTESLQINTETVQAFDTAIEKKVSELYADEIQMDLFDHYEVTGQHIACTQEGQMLLLSRVEISLKTTEGQEKTRLVQLAIEL